MVYATNTYGVNRSTTNTHSGRFDVIEVDGGDGTSVFGSLSQYWYMGTKAALMDVSYYA